MSGAPTRPMPRYKCHKEVSALKIAEIRQPDLSDPGALLVPVDSRFAPIKVSAVYMAKHAPAAGGYFVQYDDGYESFSPAEAFESGYTQI